MYTDALPSLWACLCRYESSHTALLLICVNAQVTGLASSATSDRGAESSAPSSDMDPREFVEEVDLQRKLKGTAFHELLGEEKWSEQLKGLQLVIESIGEGEDYVV